MRDRRTGQCVEPMACGALASFDGALGVVRPGRESTRRAAGIVRR